MKRRNVLVGAAVLTAAVLSTSAGAAMASDARSSSGGTVAAQDRATAVLPESIQVPPGNILIGDFLGKGVQVYQCTAGAWAFVEPAANLAGWVKRPGITATAVHFRGPSWESTDDGSLVEARVVASSPVPGSIPQLLLQSTRNRGDGVFGHVSFLQRLATRGGLAPAGDCKDGQTVGVPYQSQYRFFVPSN